MTLASHFAAHALRPTDVSATRADAIASTGPVSRPRFHTKRSAAPDTDSTTRLLQDNDHARQYEGQVLEVLRPGRADVGKDEAAAREADGLGRAVTGAAFDQGDYRHRDPSDGQGTTSARSCSPADGEGEG